MSQFQTIPAGTIVTPVDWQRWGSAAVSDALRKLGHSFQSLDGGIRPVSSANCLAGPVFTVRCYPGATWAIEQALELAAPGDVLMIDAGGRPDVIIMGSLMSRRAHARGIAGAIVDGAVRDIEEIAEIGFPVFSRHICPRAGTHAEIGEWQTTICCGRVPVIPGDWVVADLSGVTLVPQTILAAVAAEAAVICQREVRIAELLREGRPLAEAATMAKAGAML